MCKATKKADSYTITRDARTKAYNITLNGAYSRDLHEYMRKTGFKWSKTNTCFYGWTKDIQSVSVQVQALVFDWRNVNNHKKPVEVALVYESDIETVEIYKNHREYVQACKASDERVIRIDALDDIVDDLPFDPAPEVVEHIKATTTNKEENNIKEEAGLRHYIVKMTDTSLKDEKELHVQGLRVSYEFDAVDEKDARAQAKKFDPAKRIVSVHEYKLEMPEGWRVLEGALTAPNGYYWATNGASLLSGKRETVLIKEGAAKVETVEEQYPTLEELNKKYGVGPRKVDTDGRFYTGSNNNSDRWEEILNKYDPERKHPRHSSLGKYIKDIIKKELGITVSARFKWATHTPELNITLKGTRSEMFKSWDELTDAERFDYASELTRNGWYWIWYGISSRPNMDELYPVARKYYETFSLSEKWLRGKYRVAHDFAKWIMDSFQYDHTGSFMGDCDYIDCDYFDFVYIEITDRMDVDESNKIYEEITNWMYAKAKECKEYDAMRLEEYKNRTQGAAA